ncbi:putative YhdH/YhfP family quinone oxidoreductase [Paraburkholderia unamae]|uniref:YhdH/YhfP family quinone oxidoreductase n=1 Tax=Paraburkholderia unamae TaxID=219649 RepID=A0ABX5KBZ3_9BURK|nr:putative YhdH/YhfP family quinone oxidoreductase [Paraburkholderia unamae]CAG9246418.1 Acrylyl-CoA reductase AcuI [Paraburkholderia unamae]
MAGKYSIAGGEAVTSPLRAIRVDKLEADDANDNANERAQSPVRGVLVDLPHDADAAPGPGEVVIRTVHSAVNYKDALAVTGRAPIMRRLPCIAGIEAYGTVERSADVRFRPGDAVAVHGFGIGVEHDGGFASRVRANADWVMPLPDGLDFFCAATLGVAGFTAALALHRMEHNGLTPGAGPVVVTGATGGVASLGIAMLAAAGYEVVAITGKADAAAWLQAIGAATVLPRSAIEPPGKPLRSARWAGALDSVGGETLAWLASTMREGAPIAAFGNAGGNTFDGSVLPFILRGVQLLGINANPPMPLRREVWARMAGVWRPRGLERFATTIRLEDVPEHCERQVRGQTRGRAVIRFD